MLRCNSVSHDNVRWQGMSRCLITRSDRALIARLSWLIFLQIPMFGNCINHLHKNLTMTSHILYIAFFSFACISHWFERRKGCIKKPFNVSLAFFVLRSSSQSVRELFTWYSRTRKDSHSSPVNRSLRLTWFAWSHQLWFEGSQQKGNGYKIRQILYPLSTIENRYSTFFK